MFQGDMVMNAAQLKHMEESKLAGSFESTDIMENAETELQYLWPNNELKYQLDINISSNHKDRIRNTLKNLERNLGSCIRFVEASYGPRVYVKDNSSKGCSSEIGYQSKLKQSLNLAKNCMRTGKIQHEFLHALGLYHTQSRSDRDKYVEIIWKNIKNGTEDNINSNKINFMVYGGKTYGLPYDIGSVMHYPDYAFGIKDGRGSQHVTIKAVLPSNQDKMGQREGVSPGDIEMLRRHYECYKQTTTTTTTGRLKLYNE